MTLRLNGDSSGFTEIKAADTAGDNSIKLPASNGSANELLKNGGTAGELEFATDVVVDSSDRLLVGTPTFVGAGGGAKLQVISDDGSDTRGITMGDSTTDQKLHLGVLNSGTSYITFGGYYDSGWSSDDAGNTLAIGTIQLSATTTGSNIQFRTSATANSSPLTHVEIQSDGTLALNSTCPGIDFDGLQTESSATGATDTSTVLDHYEVGTWTPTALNYGDTFFMESATYVRIGRLVHVQFYVSFGATSDTSAIEIGGLPFPAHTPTGNYSLITAHSSADIQEFHLRPQFNTNKLVAVALISGNGDYKPSYSLLSGKFIIAGGTYLAAE